MDEEDLKTECKDQVEEPNISQKPTEEDSFNALLAEFPEYTKELTNLLRVLESDLFFTLSSIKKSKSQTSAFLHDIMSLLTARRLKE